MGTTKNPAEQEDAQVHEAMTTEELAQAAEPNAVETTTDTAPAKRSNAFAEMMSAAKKPKPEPTSTSPAREAKEKANPVFGRHGLGIYIDHPEKNPEGRVVEYDDEFVVIRDKFPKASVHLLLIPRNKDYQFAHPLKLLSTNTSFLSSVRARIPHLKSLAASELRRQFGHLSASDKPYQTALEDLMSGPDPPSLDALPSDMPTGRDYASEIKVGVHTHPSMNHLHIHILSKDMHSAHLKHRKHYNSFTTSFFVGIDEFPLEEGSERFHPGDWPSWEMRCWRCGEGFGNKFAKLKEHLEGEFGEWCKE